MSSQFQNCRMYANKYPEVDDVVMVEVKSIAEMGAYVQLLEYNGIEGMILLSELSRRRIRSITKLIKVGRQEPVMVLRVDKEKGYIDLSKRRVSPEDLAACEERYNKSKLVHSIMRHVAETESADLIELYSTVAWPLYKLMGHAFDAFKYMVIQPDEMWQKLADENAANGRTMDVVTPNVKKALMSNVNRRLTPQPLKIRADIEMTCFHYDGVEHIKAAMRAAEACGTEATEVKMKLVAPPLYVMTTQTLDKALGIEVLIEACKQCKASIESARGKVVIKSEARVVSAQDDRLLNDQLEQLAQANAEVDGDLDSEDEDDVGMGDVDISGPGLTA